MDRKLEQRGDGIRLTSWNWLQQHRSLQDRPRGSGTTTSMGDPHTQMVRAPQVAEQVFVKRWRAWIGIARDESC